MKQHITKEQWDELDDKQKDNFWDIFNGAKEITRGHTLKDPDWSIGDLIEFLGDEWLIAPESSMDGKLGIYSIVWAKKDELCDELWEAVREKLK